jgi:hypothetical protein
MQNEECRNKFRSVLAFRFFILHSTLILFATVLFWNSLSNFMKISGRRGGRSGHFSGKPDSWFMGKYGALIAFQAAMSSSFDYIYKKMASSLEAGGPGHMHEAKLDPARHISPVVAHELNNLFTIIQGYADRLALKHNQDSALETHLKLISEASRRAATVVRGALPPRADLSPHPQPDSPPLVPTA